MRATIKYSLAVLLLIIFLVGIYLLRPLSVERKTSIFSLIPEEAKAVILLNGNSLVQLLEKELLLHPSKLLELKKIFADESDSTSKLAWLIRAGFNYQDTLIGLHFEDSTSSADYLIESVK